MVPELRHAMRPDLSADDRARQGFATGLRAFVLHDLAADMRRAYDTRVLPALEQRLGRAPADGVEVHKAMRGDTAFQAYSAMRVNAQEMVWASVRPVVTRQAEALRVIADGAQGGAVVLDPDLEMPRNVTALDVHFMPGSYTGAGAADDIATGAVYDQGLAVFSFGLMGENLDDIGRSMAHAVRRRFPAFAPTDILDIGCTIGHNTVPWAKAYPDARVEAIDVAGPCLTYGRARAALQGADITFRQMDATRLAYPDASFDLVFSSMFLHELSLPQTASALAEAHRVLRPGGMMLHMELPPNGQMGAYDSFYLDWDCYYNAEPFYKAYRDQDPRTLCAKAGFPGDGYFQFVVPSLGFYGEEATNAALDGAAKDKVADETTGRLADGVRWYGYGAWKARA